MGEVETSATAITMMDSDTVGDALLAPVSRAALHWGTLMTAKMLRDQYMQKHVLAAYVLTSDEKYKEPAWIGKLLDQKPTPR